MRITLKEIAKMAKVSRSTVDKVLHKREGVSDRVRLRVQKIIFETGYKPNAFGQALQKQNATIRIAVVLLKNDALPMIIDGVENAFKENKDFDIKLSYFTSEYSHVEDQRLILEQCIDDQVDGIILSPINSVEICNAVNRAVDAGIKIVTANFDILEGRHLCYVGQNVLQAGAIAAGMMGLFLGGKGKVALIMITEYHADTSHFEGRREGFISQLEREFPEVEIVDSIAGYDDPVIIERETRSLLERQPELNGIFITGGSVALIGKLLKEYGVAKKIKVICFERYADILELLREGVVNCTIDSDLFSQGRKSLEILLQMIVYKKKPESRFIFTKNEILFKGSIDN